MKRGALLAVLSAAVCAAAAVLLPACAGGPGAVGGEPSISYAEVRAAYNERVAGFDSLWARATVVLEGRDVEGDYLREQVEGHLQIEPPDRLALTLGKLGDTHLYLGANPERYWFFDMVDADAKRATVGRHELLTAEKARELGLPVFPLDLVDLLGVVPLPEQGRVIAANGPRVLVRAEVGGVPRRLVLDAETLRPEVIELLDRGGEPVLRSELAAYRITPIAGGDFAGWVPTRATVTVRGLDVELRLRLFEPTVKDIRPQAFDPDRLVRAFRIGEVIDLDDPGAAAQGP